MSARYVAKHIRATCTKMRRHVHVDITVRTDCDPIVELTGSSQLCWPLQCCQGSRPADSHRMAKQTVKILDYILIAISDYCHWYESASTAAKLSAPTQFFTLTPKQNCSTTYITAVTEIA